MKKSIFAVLTLLFAFTVFFAGCEDRKDLDPITPVTPAKPALGTTNFDKFVSLGNSITAGYQSGALYESGQKTSYGYLIAKQVQTAYTYPAISEPGIGGKIYLAKLDLSTNPATPILAYGAADAGQPLNSAQATGYNNLGIPGAILYDMIDTALNYSVLAQPKTTPGGRGNPFYSIVLRNGTMFGRNPLEQAVKLGATFMTLWIGNNDVLGYATTGGTSGTDRLTQKLPTDTATFGAIYRGLIAKISGYLPATKVAVGNIPDVKAVPFFTTVGLSVYLKLKDAGISTLYYQNRAASGGVAGASLTDLATLKVMLTLSGSTYAAELGKPSGKFYTDNEIAVPSGVDITKPFGLHPQNPFPDALVLDSLESATASAAVAGFNKIISDAISGKSNFTLVDVNGFFNQLRAADNTGGTLVDGYIFKTSYLSGGLFSLDGVHPSSQAHAIIANKFIERINAAWGASILPINVATIPINMNLLKAVSVDKYGLPRMPAGTFDNLKF